MKNRFLRILSWKYLFVTVCVCVAIAAIILIALTFNIYPVAMVNYTHLIMAYQLNKGLDVAIKFYGMNSTTSEKEFKQAVFEGLIDQVSINAELSKDMSASNINQKVGSQIDQVIGDVATQKSLSAIGISIDDAKKYVLEIAIKNELVKSQLQLGEKDFLKWLVEQRKDLKVYILMLHAHWTGQGITFD